MRPWCSASLTLAPCVYQLSDAWESFLSGRPSPNMPSLLCCSCQVQHCLLQAATGRSALWKGLSASAHEQHDDCATVAGCLSQASSSTAPSPSPPLGPSVLFNSSFSQSDFNYIITHANATSIRSQPNPVALVSSRGVYSLLPQPVADLSKFVPPNLWLASAPLALSLNLTVGPGGCVCGVVPQTGDHAL